MKNDETLNKQPHWRCRLCGHSTPLGQAVCSNPNCRADLGIYGEAITPGQEDDDRSAWKRWEDDGRQREEEARRQEEEARQRKDEAQRQKAEEQRRRTEEKAQAKAARQTGWSGSGAPKWLVPALAAALILALGIGAGVFFAGRSTAENPTPPRQSADPGPSSRPTRTEKPGALESDAPGPDESQPGQGKSPASDAWTGNVLMADPFGDDVIDDDAAKKYPAFGSQFERQDFCSITFLDSLDDLHGTQWDVSQDQDGSVMAWADLNSGTKLYDLYIGAEGGVEAPADCCELFSDYVNVERISFNGAFHTENAVLMFNMFFSCESLREVDVSGFDTSSVIDMGGMFGFCENLQRVDISGFDTSNVTDMAYMFAFCDSLQEADVSDFDTFHVTDMSYMFYGCHGLTQLDVSGFDTSSVTDMSCMFRDCSGLAELDVSSFDTSKVTDMAGMFMHCYNLRSLDMSGFDTSSVITMYFMFCGCKSLTALDVSSFDTSSVTKMTQMFSGCSGLAKLDIANFKTGKVTDMTEMFSGVADNFVLHYSPENFDTSSVTEYDGFMPDSFDWRKVFE